MARILANDGIDAAGKKILEAAGHEVVTEKVAQENLSEALKKFDAILVRSATTVRKENIDAAPNVKLIGRAGVGTDNIDVKYAQEKGIKVVNTPAASSQSVAELVFAHLFTMARFLHDSNRVMPTADTKEKFNALKKKYSEGIELSGKTIGIIGAGMIGKAVAKMAAGLGMNILFHDAFVSEANFDLNLHPSVSAQKISLSFKCIPIEKLLAESDFITLHIPFPKGSAPVIAYKEFGMTKKGVGIVNTARPGVVSEKDLLEALNSGKVAYAGLDVFEGEPVVSNEVRSHADISLSPHIGGSTKEAQERIGIELAEKVAEFFQSGK
ncbi:MAG TPA: NAD(P)-dependent oxidoreductase [Bacteroidia bacterium]|nr:NAD(P)-dependent oxidoreductase [Bacteroidia bacterium]